MGTTRRLLAAAAATIIVGGLVTGVATPASAVTPTPTSAPGLAAPAAGATVTGNPVFKWSAVASAVKYRFQVSTSSTFGSTLYSVDTYALRATPTKDLPNGTLYWRVAGTNGSTGVGPYAVRQYVKNGAAGPVLSAPANAAVLTYPTDALVLRWSALSGVKSYKVELDDADDFVGAQSFTTVNTSLALPEPLILDKAYYWRVQGVSATTGITTNFSAAWTFQVQWPDGAGTPVLLAPDNDAVAEVTDVVFRWKPVAGAKTYQIQVSPNPEFANNLAEDRIVKGTQYSPATTYDNATYYWRVRALDTGATQHEGPWSDAWLFNRGWTEKPVATFPIGGESTADQRFTWDGVKHASHYEFQISTDANFSTLYAACTSFHTTFSPLDVTTAGHSTTYPPNPTSPPADAITKNNCNFSLAAGGHYYWRIRGVDMPKTATGVFSDTADFYYVPAMPTITGPEDGVTTGAPVLTWDPVPGYSRYKVTYIGGPLGTTTTVTTYSTAFTPIKKLDAGNYEWWVVTVDSQGKEGMAPSGANRRHFTVVKPSGSSSITEVGITERHGRLKMPSMSWTPLAGTDYYQVWVGQNGIFTKISGSAELPCPAYTATSEPLAPGTYQWYAEAFDKYNAFLGTSPTGEFEIVDLDFAEYVGPPNCTQPACPTQESTPELQWSVVDGAGSYRVWVALDPQFTNIVRGYETRDTTLTPRESYPDNEAGESYYWYVQPCKSPLRCGEFNEASTGAHEQAFRKQSLPVTLTGPDDTVTPDLPDVVSFSWEDYGTTTDKVTGVKQYRLQVATDPSFGVSTIKDDVTVDQPAYQAWSKSYPDGVYYWRVQAIDGGNIPLTFSAPRTFQKTSAVPTPTSTATTTGLPTLTWTATAYASGYTVEIYSGAGSPPFQSVNKVRSATTKLPSYTPDAALAAGTYSWRVRKLSPDGDGGKWSTSVPTFTVAQPAPTLTSPADQAKIKTNDMLFTWQAVNGASAYRFESSASSGFGTAVEQVSTVMTAWAPTKLYSDGATYYWRIRVLDSGNNVMATSATRRITKDATRPTVTSVSPTTDLAVNGTVTVKFSESVKGVSTAGLVLRMAGTTNTVAGTVTPSSTTSTTTATYRPKTPLVPGKYYNLTVGSGITDAIGNTVVAKTTQIRTARKVENTSPALTERWDVDYSSSASGGAYISARTAGAATTFRFTGTAVSVLGHTSKTGGYANVYLDGAKQSTINFYGASPAFKKTMYRRTGLASKAHTLVVRVLGTKPSASKGTYVDLDAFVAGSTYQESSSAVTTSFGRTSTSSAGGGSFDRTMQESDTSGAEYRFSFCGAGFTWYATQLSSGGSAKVYIDGKYRGTVNLYSSYTRYRRGVFTSPTLSSGIHSVRLIATGAVPKGSSGTYVTLDWVQIR